MWGGGGGSTGASKSGPPAAAVGNKYCSEMQVWEQYRSGRLEAGQFAAAAILTAVIAKPLVCSAATSYSSTGKLVLKTFPVTCTHDSWHQARPRCADACLACIEQAQPRRDLCCECLGSSAFSLE